MQGTMRTLIANNQEDVSQEVREALLRQGADGRDDDVVPLDRVLDRSSRTMPEALVAVLLPSSPEPWRMQIAGSLLLVSHRRVVEM
jgi:hypothetical protein